VAIIWLVIVLLGAFYLTTLRSHDLASLVVVPEVPRLGKPVIVTFKLNNASAAVSANDYQLFMDGKLLESGTVMLPPDVSKQYEYIYLSSLPVGSNSSFLLKVHGSDGDYQKMVATPPFQPQLASSFVSFAAFSTTMMTSMASADYYNSTFQQAAYVNVGLVCSLVLFCILIFLELFRAAVGDPLSGGMVSTKIQRLAFDISPLTWTLLAIFIAMVYTRVIMILIGS
jgi:hypothetical protein